MSESCITAVQNLAGILVGRQFRDEDIAAFDWRSITDIAEKSDVLRMLHISLVKLGITPPTDTAELLKSFHHEAMADGVKRHHLFGKMLDVLVNAGIVVIPVKGVWLSETVYSNIAMRGMADIDLWIRKEDVHRAIDAMGSIGYEVSSSRQQRPQELQDALLGETLLFRKGTPFVELHWRIFAGEWLRHTACIDERLIWEQSLFWKSEMVRQLQPEDSVIHVAVHLAVNHRMSDSVLRSLLDLHLMRQKLNIDWNQVVVRAVSQRVAVSLWLVLDTMKRLFGDDETLSAVLHEVSPSAFRQRVMHLFISPERLIAGEKIAGVKKFIFLLFLVDRPVDALSLAWRSLWPDCTWLTLRYGLKNPSMWKISWQRLLHLLRVVRYRDF